MTAQEEIFGPGAEASDTTMLRVPDELAGRLCADGLPGRWLARATAGARAKAWAGIVDRHGGVAGGAGRRDRPGPARCRLR